MDLQIIAATTRQLANADPNLVRITGRGSRAGLLNFDSIDRLRLAIDKWLAQPIGADLRVAVLSDRPLPSALVQIIGSEALLGRPFSCADAATVNHDQSVLDFSGYIGATQHFPPVLPDPDVLCREGYPLHYPRVHVPRPVEGIRLGCQVGDQERDEVLLGGIDRLQHCYIVGSTGTGKSTLLRSMVLQDIQRIGDTLGKAQAAAALVDSGSLSDDELEKLSSLIKRARKDGR